MNPESQYRAGRPKFARTALCASVARCADYLLPAQTIADAALSDEDNNDSDRFPAFALTSVEDLRTTHEPKLDVVVVYGLTSSDGWTEAELVHLRHSDRSASDGVLDLV
jgi:hypothetical protein